MADFRNPFDEPWNDAGSFGGAGKQMAGGDALGGAWSGIKTADKGGVINKLGSLLGGGSKFKPYDPNLGHFQYGGTGEGQFQQWGQQMQGRQGPQVDYANALQSRGLGMQSRQTQQDAINQYKRLLTDPNSSVAQQQLRGGQQANAAAMLMAARSGSPGQSAANMRNAMVQGMAGGAQMNQQAGLLRAQETQGAISGLAQAATAQRAADLQAQGLDAQSAQYQAGLEMQQRGLNDQTMMGLYGLGQNASMAQMQGMTDYEKLRAQQWTEAGKINAQNKGALLGTLGTAATAGAMIFSDERAKEKIQVLQDRNSLLQDHLQRALTQGPGAVVGEMAGRAAKPQRLERLPTPAVTGSQEGRQPQNELEAERYGRDWLIARKTEAAADYLRQQQYLEELQKAQAQRDIAATQYAQPIAPVPSDERSKQKIQALEGMVDDYQRRLAGSAEYPTLDGDRAVGVGSIAAYPRDSSRGFEPSSAATGRFDDAGEAVNQLRPVAFDYKPEFKQYGQGRQVGILAQDLERTPIGAQAVVPGPQGMKAVDAGKASTLALAASAEQEHRLRALEEEYMRRLGGRASYPTPQEPR